MNGAKLEESNGWKMVFGERIPETQKGENSRLIMMVAYPVRFLWDWTRDGLERMAIFLASRAAKPSFILAPARFFEVPVPQPLPEVFSYYLREYSGPRVPRPFFVDGNLH